MKTIIYTDTHSNLIRLSLRLDYETAYQEYVAHRMVQKITPVLWNNLKVSEMTEELYIDFVMEKDIPKDAINARVIPVEELDLTRTFRDGWVDDGSNITVKLTDELKKSHKQKMMMVELSKLPRDELGRLNEADIKLLENDVLALDLSGVSTIDELYNSWIDRGVRGYREYNGKDEKLRKYLPNDDIRKKGGK